MVRFFKLMFLKYQHVAPYLKNCFVMFTSFFVPIRTLCCLTVQSLCVRVWSFDGWSSVCVCAIFLHAITVQLNKKRLQTGKTFPTPLSCIWNVMCVSRCCCVVLSFWLSTKHMFMFSEIVSDGSVIHCVFPFNVQTLFLHVWFVSPFNQKFNVLQCKSCAFSENILFIRFYTIAFTLRFASCALRLLWFCRILFSWASPASSSFSLLITSLVFFLHNKNWKTCISHSCLVIFFLFDTQIGVSGCVGGGMDVFFVFCLSFSSANFTESVLQH